MVLTGTHPDHNKISSMKTAKKSPPPRMMATEDDCERTRFDSHSSTDSGFEGLEGIEPLDLGDIESFKVGNSKRLDSGTTDVGEWSEDYSGDEFPQVSLFSVAMSLRKKWKHSKPFGMLALSSSRHSRGRRNWIRAIAAIKTGGVKDSWEKFNLHELPVENVTRHRYNALTKTWTKDMVVVKIDKEHFDEGAMRKCYRMKKMPRPCLEEDWMSDSNNYVAKCYKSDEDRETYFEDIRLQMNAKLWGEEYNRHNPPKKVDIFMVSVYEFHERDGSPLFHVEHFIDGEYIKYNSNSGFVDNRVARQTPHAFSHFTFERSGHELIVVDVQGVGDLYTDPQIHTVDGDDYGEGNLGVKGMALFFHSHECNSICKSLGLAPFQLSDTEQREIHSNSSSAVRSTCSPTSIGSQTVLRGGERAVSESDDGCSPISSHLHAFFRHRYPSGRVRTYSESVPTEEDEAILEDGGEDSYHPHPWVGSSFRRQQAVDGVVVAHRRGRRSTEVFEETEVFAHAQYLQNFRDDVLKKCRTTSLNTEIHRAANAFDDSVLGLVHLELAKYHEVCRFSDDGTYDKATAMFHLKAAADCGVVNAILNVAYIYCELPHDILSDVCWKDCLGSDDQMDEVEAKKIGFDYMEKAANAGDRNAMVYIAHAYDTGLNLPLGRCSSLSLALYWYEEVTEFDELSSTEAREPDWGISDPPYVILARQAEIYLTGGEGAPGINRNPTKAAELYETAAEQATEAMKGKLATKYYMMMEEAYAQVEE